MKSKHENVEADFKKRMQSLGRQDADLQYLLVKISRVLFNTK